MKGSTIVLAANPKGVELEGVISGTPKPGTVMQIQAGTAMKGGRPTWEAYNPTADNDPRIAAVLVEDRWQGKTYSDAYVSGTRGFLYVPLPGEELNMIIAGQPGAGTGTTSAVTIGERFLVERTGKLVIQNTSSSRGPFTSLEATTETNATDAWVWTMFNGW